MHAKWKAQHLGLRNIQKRTEKQQQEMCQQIERFGTEKPASQIIVIQKQKIEPDVVTEKLQQCVHQKSIPVQNL